MYQLDLPWMLVLLPLPMLVWWVLPSRRETSASVRLPFFHQVAKAAGIDPTSGSVAARRGWLQLGFETLAWCLMVLALTRPQFVEPPIEKVEPQRDLMLALDLSQSMDTRDFKASDGSLERRVEAVRTVVADFVKRRPGDRIGLIAFGDAPYPLVPFTMDHDTVEDIIAESLPGMAGPRTSLGDAIGLAIKMFEKTTVPQKVLIVLTDGNDTASKMPPAKAAEIAKRNGVVSHTVGIGDPAATGEDKLDTATLEKIARDTGGRYFFGEDPTQLADIYRVLDAITPENQKNLSWRPRIELFHWPLGASIAVLAAYYLASGAVGLARRRGSGMIEDFHFIRPWWLASLLLPLVILWLASRSTDVRSQWKAMIAPHLLDRLVVEVGRGSRFRPSWLLATALAFAALGVAGPTWQQQAPPFVEDIAPLVIAVDLSPTMDAIDVTPSRIERAKLKIKDIIATRAGARTGVIAYSGSAHVVLPLTEDGSLIETYTDALATRIMPDAGKDTAGALELAGQMLSREQSSGGTILIVTDGVEAKAFEAFKRERADGLVVLGIGTAEGGLVKARGGFLTDANGARVSARLDVAALKTLHSATGAEVATSTDDDRDVRWVAQRVRNQFARKLATKGDLWRDMGWWLVLPLALLFSLSFRRGWVVRVSVLLFSLRLLVPAQVEAGEIADMWLTPDQQGRIAYDRGDYLAASAHFSNPMWKGVAFYRAGKFADAVDAFATVDSAESWYDQGNAFMWLSKFEEAVAAYRKALEKRQGWVDAADNLAMAERLLKIQKDRDQDQPEEPNEKPDQVQFDDKGKKGKQGQIDIAEQTSEMWMKNIQVSPADLMARKFAIEAARQKQ